MRLLGMTATLAAVVSLSATGWAQAPATPAAPPAPPAATAAATPDKPADPVVGKVDDQEIHLSELREMAQTIPEEYRSMPAQVLFPMLLDQAIDRRAIGMLAHKQGLDHDPAVQEQVKRAAEQALQNALISREIGPTVTEAAIRARYDATIAGKPGEQEVHARHILVASEDLADKLTAELKAGGDFAALAKANSTDPGAAQGGDLGFFKKGDMLPEFSAVAFALKPGQVSDKPVHTRYGWHVIKVEEVRETPPMPFEQAHDELRQQMVQEGVQKLLTQARAGVVVEKFNPDGTPIRETDAIVPPPAASK